jgi:hypothetical protein
MIAPRENDRSSLCLLRQVQPFQACLLLALERYPPEASEYILERPVIHKVKLWENLNLIQSTNMALS